MVINCCGRNLIFDEITGVVPTDTCPTICLTVSDASSLPDPPTGCEFALLSFATLSDWAKMLYLWDGAAWGVVARVTGTFLAGEIDTADVVLTGTWTVTINGDSYTDGAYSFDPDLAFADIVFTDGACSYEMERVESPVSLMSWTFVDVNSLPFDPNEPSNWNQGIDGMIPTDVQVTGNQVEVFGFVTGNGSIGDAGFTAFTSNLIYVSDNEGFIIEVIDAAFLSSTGLAGVSFPAVQIVGIQAFNSCTSFSSLGSAVITTIGQGAFNGTQMSEGTHLLCTYLGAQSFSGTACATLNFPLLEEIEVSTFDQMASLTSADFAACLIIGESAFETCPALNSVNFPLAHTIRDKAFSNEASGSISDLTSASFPEVLTIYHSAFRNNGLTTISLPKCTSWEENPNNNLSYIFYDCLNLVEIIAPLLTNMGGSSGDNDCFVNIAGNTIDLTVNAVLLTNNGGNPDGDIQYLQANNTVNIL